MKTLLIVDDDKEITETIEKELKDSTDSVTTITCNYGYQALGYILGGKIDIVLTDIAMPDMDGYELFKRAREYNPQIPVIMMTGFGYDPNHTIIKAKKNGITKLLYKPFEVDYLIKIIESLPD